MNASAEWTDWSCRIHLIVERPAALPAARAHTAALMAQVGRAVDRFDPASELSTINRRAGTMTPVSPLCLELVHAAVAAARLTEGGCDPTVGAHLMRAGYDRDIETVRSATRSAEPSAMEDPPLPDWRQIKIDPELRLVGIPVRLSLDLGATAKAWTAQRCAQQISSTFDTAVLVSLGGDVAAGGRPRRPWQIAVSEQPGSRTQIVTIEQGSIATSTTTIRAWERSGRRYHHIIDPRTGHPSTGRWRTASVCADDAVEANALSTALIALGDDATTLLTRTGAPARLVDDDGRVHLSGGWPDAGSIDERCWGVVA